MIGTLDRGFWESIELSDFLEKIRVITEISKENW